MHQRLCGDPQLHQGTVTLESNGKNGILVMRLTIVRSSAE